MNHKKFEACLAIVIIVLGIGLGSGIFSQVSVIFSSVQTSGNKSSTQDETFQIKHSPPKTIIQEGSGIGGASYTIFGVDKDGDNIEDEIYAKSGDNGQIVFGGTDADEVIQSVMNTMEKGGKIHFSSGCYLLDNTITVPARRPWVLEGEGNVSKVPDEVPGGTVFLDNVFRDIEWDFENAAGQPDFYHTIVRDLTIHSAGNQYGEPDNARPIVLLERGGIHFEDVSILRSNRLGESKSWGTLVQHGVRGETQSLGAPNLFVNCILSNGYRSLYVANSFLRMINVKVSGPNHELICAENGNAKFIDCHLQSSENVNQFVVEGGNLDFAHSGLEFGSLTENLFWMEPGTEGVVGIEDSWFANRHWAPVSNDLSRMHRVEEFTVSNPATDTTRYSENNGTATILNGNTSVTVAHGLWTAPSKSGLRITPLENIGGKSVWISDINSENFTINVSSPVNENRNFAWGAKVKR